MRNVNCVMVDKEQIVNIVILEEILGNSKYPSYLQMA